MAARKKEVLVVEDKRLNDYELVFIKAVNDLDVKILLPVILGAGFGLLAFSHFLSWIFKRFRDITISLLTGFILGSLSILWPDGFKQEIKNVPANKLHILRYPPEAKNTIPVSGLK